MKYSALISLLCLGMAISGMASADGFSYCGGLLKFTIPDNINKSSIYQQSVPPNCKSELIINGNNGRVAKVVISQGDDYLTKPSDLGDDYFKQYKKANLKLSHSEYTRSDANGTATISTITWSDSNGEIKSKEQDYFFGKKGTISLNTSYKGNPDNPGGMIFMQNIEKIFKSMKIDWTN